MPEYRIYLLDPDDRIRDYRVVESADDQQATQAATLLLDGNPGVEIWAGTRLVGRIGCTSGRDERPAGQIASPSPCAAGPEGGVKAPELPPRGPHPAPLPQAEEKPAAQLQVSRTRT